MGDAYDNAMAESFFSTLDMACFSYIEAWYNPMRPHSGLGYRSPIAYEAERETLMTDP